MNKSFYIAVTMFITASLFIALITSNVITGIGLGSMLALATYVFFEYEFFQIKKDWKLTAISSQSKYRVVLKNIQLQYTPNNGGSQYE